MPAAAPAAAAAAAPAAAASAAAPATPTAAAQPPSVPSAPSAQVVATADALISMGYPEVESRAVSAAARGNLDLALHYFDNGIPEDRTPSAAPAPAPAASAAASSAPAVAAGSDTVRALESFRLHPQFNLLRQTVQQDPAQLPAILNVIGQQQPELLAAIHANEAAFLAMMNEPISASQAAPSAAPRAAHPMGNPGDPAAMIGMLAQLPEEQRAHFAQSIGMSPQQLAQFMQMVSSMPPDALTSLLSQGGLGGMPGGGHPPPNSVTLTPDEMAAVQRLEELGGGRFSRQQAAEAYLSCERNEMMAAQLLLDGGWGDDDDYGDGGGGGNDDMYN